MGFLLDLLLRWFGVPRTLEAAPPAPPAADPAAASSPRPAAEAEPSAPAPVDTPAAPQEEPQPANGLPWLAAPSEPAAEVDSPESTVEAGARIPLADTPEPSEPPTPAPESTPAVEQADPVAAEAPESHEPEPTDAPTPVVEIERPVVPLEPPFLVAGSPAEDRDDSDALDAADSPEEAPPLPAALVEESAPAPPAEGEPEAGDDPAPESEAPASLELPDDPAVEPPAREADLPTPFEPAEPPEPEAAPSADRTIDEPAVVAPAVAGLEPAQEVEPPALPAGDDAGSPAAVAAGLPSAEAPPVESALGSPGAAEAEPAEPPATAATAEVEPPVAATWAEGNLSVGSNAKQKIIGLLADEPGEPEVRADVASPAEPEVDAAAPAADEERDAAIDLPIAAELPAEADPVESPDQTGEDAEDESTPEIEVAEGAEGELPAVVSAEPGAESTDSAVEVEAGPPLEAIEAEPEVVRMPESAADLDLFAGPETPGAEPEPAPDMAEAVESDPESEPVVESVAEFEPPVEAITGDTDADPVEAVDPSADPEPGSPAEATPDEAGLPITADDPGAVDLFASDAPGPETTAGMPADGAADSIEPSEVDLFAADPIEATSPAEGEPSAEAVEVEHEPEASDVAAPPDDEEDAEGELHARGTEPGSHVEVAPLLPFEDARPGLPNAEPPAGPGLAEVEPEVESGPTLDAGLPPEDEAADGPDVEPAPTVAPDSPAGAPPRPAPLGLAGDLESPLWASGGADFEAMAEDPAARAVRHAERRAAAAAAREERRAAAAERRATNIIYLGRGVSEALHDRAGDHARLDELGLPHLDSPADLADQLGIAVGRLRWLAFHAEVASRVHYVGFDVPKRGGGTRHLSAPHRSLAEAQRWIFEEIVARLPVEAEAHGFVPGRSIVTNARPHAGRAVVANLDLEGFFPGIGFRRVRAVFERAGYSPALATILGLLCTEAPRRVVTLDGATLHVATGSRGLPQGACTSPGLSNQVARRLDRRLAGLARALGATYTRYADDLTFSGGPALDPKVGHLLAQIRRIAASEGFRVNEAKTRVQRPNAAQTVTGLVVNDRPGVARAEVRRLRAILHRARLEGLDAQNHAGHSDFRAYLEGMIAFVGMARPEAGARLREEFRALGDG